MQITFSRHARRQMRWRKISEDEVRNAVADPEVVADSIKGRMNAFKHLGEKFLKVTYTDEGGIITIVTVIDKGK